MKRLLSANVPEKLAALAIALLLWQIVLHIEQPVTSRTFENIPVSYTSPGANLLATERVSSIRVDANALLSGGDSIDQDEIVATVDLSNAKPGRGRYPVMMSYTGSPASQIELTPRPKTVEVVIEKWITRELPVTATTTGAWDTYRPGPITVTPSKVRISGQESRVSLATDARVEVNLSSVEPGSSSQAPVQILTETGKPLELTVDPTTVTVRVRPVALPPSKNVIVQPIFNGTPAFGYRIASIEVVPNQIRVMGAADDLETPSSVNTAAVNVTGITDDTTITVGLALPAGVRSEVSRVEVRIRIERTG
jgi:YbbR domain-containing protein